MKARPLNLVEIRRRIAQVQRNLAPGATITVGSLREATAREALESRRGEAYTDPEWSEAAGNLRAFFGLLTEWNQGAEHDEA